MALEPSVPAIRVAPFAKGFNGRAKKVEDRIQDYLIDSNEENIHDVRTSIRRLDTSIRVLPKVIRRQPKVSDLRNYYRNFFKINSEIRDIDVIRSKFTQYPQDVTSSYPNFIETLQEHRDKKLKEAKEMALSAYNLEPLRIKKGDVSEKKLQRRYQKVATEFTNEIESLFPRVISDIGRRTELHDLRKDCKKLRYTLEVADSSAKGKRNIQGVVGLLEDMQDVLGAIHDCDIMLLHLARAKGGLHARRMNDVEDGKGDFSDLIDLEQKERVKLYYQFVSRYGNGPAQQSSGFSSKKQEIASNKAAVA